MADLTRASIHRLVEMWTNDEITADEYFTEMEVRAHDAIEREVAAARLIREGRHA